GDRATTGQGRYMGVAVPRSLALPPHPHPSPGRRGEFYHQVRERDESLRALRSSSMAPRTSGFESSSAATWAMTLRKTSLGAKEPTIFWARASISARCFLKSSLL